MKVVFVDESEWIPFLMKAWFFDESGLLMKVVFDESGVSDESFFMKLTTFKFLILMNPYQRQIEKTNEKGLFLRNVSLGSCHMSLPS